MRKRHICLIGVSLILLLWVVFAVVRDVSISRKEDGKLYYGNYDNEITGEMYDTILQGIEGIKAEF